MELSIISKSVQPLLERTQVTARISFSGQKTPSNKDVASAVAKESGKPEECIAIKSIITAFGKTEAEVKAFVYDSKEALCRTEPKPKKKEAQPEKKEG